MKSEPLFNVPAVIVALIAVLAVIHGVRDMVLDQDQDIWVLLRFAFFPARYDSSVVLGGLLLGGVAADIWTFFSYAMLHGSWMHLGINGVWLLAFGSAVARRFGTTRFLAFFAVTAAAGAAMHLLTNAGSQAPMIGASASISGAMAAAMRFAFQRGGPLGGFRSGDDEAFRVPALPLVQVFSDARVLAFLAVWFGVNILFGLGSQSLTGGDEAVAWQAHIGGFLAGLVLFSWFDPPYRAAAT
ncbi:MAG: rhomboid family intramembrane serine protease [Pseudolabrys sp.]|nr:rhomboid family intramembrane serine protease [Pseudolabrys sp.]